MTTPTPTTDETFAPLRALVDELGRLLHAGEADGADPVQLKQRIYFLHRAVAQHAEEVGRLQDDVRQLVDGWKERFGSPAAVAASHAATPAALASQPAAAAAATAHFAPPVATVEVAFTTREPTPAPPPASTPVHGQPRVIDELNASTFVERGWSRIAMGDFAAAQESLEKALSLNPGDPQAETLLGWAQMAQGRYDEAVALFDAVLARLPEYALALVTRAYVHLRHAEFEPATARLTRAIALDSDRKATLYAHFYLGLVRYEQEQFAEAIGALLRAIELGPNLIEARFELGRVYWFSGRTDDAIAAWRKGAEVNRFNPWSARCRDMLATISDGGAPARVS